MYIYICVCVFWHSFWHIQYSDILSDILSGIYSGILSGMCSGPGVAHSIWSSRYGVRVQEWPTASGAGKGDEEEGPQDSGVGGLGGEGVAPLLKSRDPHLAGRE